jgi:hypothetical protein
VIRIVDGRVTWDATQRPIGLASTKHDDEAFSFVLAGLVHMCREPRSAMMTVIELLLTFLIADQRMFEDDVPVASPDDILRLMGEYVREHSSPIDIKTARDVLGVMFDAAKEFRSATPPERK